jgi:hypothetical protein
VDMVGERTEDGENIYTNERQFKEKTNVHDRPNHRKSRSGHGDRLQHTGWGPKERRRKENRKPKKKRSEYGRF